MSSHRSRGHSPPRYYTDQPRATTGGVYVTSYDTPPRGGSPQQSRASVSTVSGGSRQSVAYSAQPMRKSTFADGKTKTEYAIRPRHDSSHPSDSVKRPLSVSTRNLSPTRRSSLLLSPRDATPVSMRDDSSRFLQPATSHGHSQGFHQRHNSTSTYAGPRDTGRDRNEKSYHARSPYVEKVYYDNRPTARLSDDEGWSYTGPREQFHRDYPQKPTERRESTSRRERPTRNYDIDRPTVRRDLGPPPNTTRHMSRDERAEKPHDTKPGFESDPDRRSEVPRRHHSTRHPVVHQQQFRDDGYSSARDEYDSRTQPQPKHGRHDEARSRDHRRDTDRDVDRDRDYDRKHHKDSDRDRPRVYDRDYDRDYDRNYDRDHNREYNRDHHRDHNRDYDREHDRDYDRDYDREYERDDKSHDSRRKQRSRDSSPERSGLKNLATTALSGLAAAGVVKGLRRDHKDEDTDSNEKTDDGSRDRRRRKHRHRSRKDDSREGSDVEDKKRRDDRPRPRAQESSSSEGVDSRVSNGSRSHRRPEEEDHDDNDEKFRGESPAADERGGRDSRANARDQDVSPSDVDRSSRALVPIRPQDEDDEPNETRTLSPGENEDDRPRRVQLVEPVKEKEEIKPKGILKPARQVPFPEDPNPIREGVAPLNAATKDGIPQHARWTKINRLLVNPEALEKAHERFEERDDYVIVLRVLTREEIKKLADKTKEIRDAREREWQGKLDERRRQKAVDNDHSTDSGGEIDYDDDRNDGSKPQLTIEQPPAPPADLHNLQGTSFQQGAPRGVAVGPPVPDVNVEANYSQNV